jgi:hypothetical protein
MNLATKLCTMLCQTICPFTPVPISPKGYHYGDERDANGCAVYKLQFSMFAACFCVIHNFLLGILIIRYFKFPSVVVLYQNVNLCITFPKTAAKHNPRMLRTA